MIRILRQLNPDEMRQVALACGSRPGALPEEVVRCLARLSGAFTWGIFPAGTDDVLLDQVGRKLGFPPLVGGTNAVPTREKAILGRYIRQGWEPATLVRKQAALQLAVAAWDHPGFPPPVLEDVTEANAFCHPTLEALLQSSAGHRALAVALENAPLPLPIPEIAAGPVRVPIAARAAQGHQALYSTLLVLWRARHRMLREKRSQRTQIERQLRQTETLLAARKRNLTAAPVRWELNPASGLSVSAGAAVAVGAHLVLAAANPALIIPAVAVGTAGLAWSATAAVLSPRPASDERFNRLQSQIQAFRSQILTTDREILQLEME